MDSSIYEMKDWEPLVNIKKEIDSEIVKKLNVLEIKSHSNKSSKVQQKCDKDNKEEINVKGISSNLLSSLAQDDSEHIDYMSKNKETNVVLEEINLHLTAAVDGKKDHEEQDLNYPSTPPYPNRTPPLSPALKSPGGFFMISSKGLENKNNRKGRKTLKVAKPKTKIKIDESRGKSNENKNKTEVENTDYMNMEIDDKADSDFALGKIKKSCFLNKEKTPTKTIRKKGLVNKARYINKNDDRNEIRRSPLEEKMPIPSIPPPVPPFSPEINVQIRKKVNANNGYEYHKEPLEVNVTDPNILNNETNKVVEENSPMEIDEDSMMGEENDKPNEFVTPIKLNKKTVLDNLDNENTFPTFKVGDISASSSKTIRNSINKKDKRSSVSKHTSHSRRKPLHTNTKQNGGDAFSSFDPNLRSPVFDKCKKLRNDASLFIEKNQFKLAEQKLNQACAAQPKDVSNLLLRSEVLKKQHKYDKALSDCYKILKINKSSLEANLNISNLYRMIGCFKLSLSTLKKIDTNTLVNAVSNVQLSLQKEIDIMQKVDCLYQSSCKILSKNPLDSSAVDMLDQVLHFCPGWPCIYLIRAIVLIARDGSTTNIQLAEQYVTQARTYTYNLSIPFFSDYLKVNNCGEDTATIISDLIRQVHRKTATNFDTVFKTLDLLESVYIEDFYIPLTISLRKERDHITNLKKAKDTANSLFTQKLYSQALFRYSEALKIDTDHNAYNAIILCNRAAAYMGLKFYKNALQDCDNALTILPNYVKARIRRARINIALDKSKAALEDFEKAVRLDPSNNIIKLEMESLKEKLRRLREAKNQQREQNRRNKYERRRHESTENEQNSSNSWRSKFYQKEKEDGFINLKTKEDDYYSLLQISQNATPKEIKKAYFKLAKITHPDKGGDANTFQIIGKAYEILSDKAKRLEYDMKRRQSFSYFRSTRFNDYPPAQPFQQQDQQQASYNTYGSKYSNQNGGSHYYYYC